MLASGVTLGSSERAELFEYATLAEEQGLESVYAGESWGAAAVPVLTQLLERTESIDVCSGIFNIYTRTPGTVAMTANTLADIGDGRFRVGLGTSGPAVIENFHGVEFDQPLRRTREYVEIIRAFLAGERVDYDGDLFELSGFALDMDEYYECPIYLAAMGETNRQLTGEFADGWMPLLVPNTGIDDALEAVERGTERGNRSIDDVDVAPWVPTCISEDDPDSAREHVRSLIGFYVGAMGEYYANAASSFGFGDEADAIQAGWQEDRQAGAEAAVTDEMVSAFGAAGTPAEAAESFDRFGEAGANSPVAYIPSRWADDDLIRETITHL
ncbi:LLM class flavin-dependent oxidoreductase [Salinadaptatus halalkaliphilus]|uniref:LLM class flavin-dependent oxidoreductase n=1 Tax=Salinadaptatus halalkaliphilus TaxID=2419781 RepID=A0A4S3THD3_9EURY|nr:LLM class flavin-dependent oxidoreductase [Salinadaptatus halalkaliphilus]THE63316.1 LLM class flavin-dependent oxidoreductase [Salinadaptatus halalkaliphilus]